MKYFYFSVWLFFSFYIVNAQEKAQEVISHFTNSSTEWEIQLPNKKNLLIQWQKRLNSFSKNGLNSFVGYYQNQFVGIITFDKQSLNGEIFYNNQTYTINTSNQGFITIENVKQAPCGAETTSKNSQISSRSLFAKDQILQPEPHNLLYPNSIIHTDGVFRIYRLALPVDYSYFAARSHFNNSVEAVKKFWSNTETALNELYTNDVGIRFEVINDDALIFKTQKEALFNYQKSEQITTYGTIEFNKRYDKTKYDLAVIITVFREKYNGVAAAYSAYEEHTKANATARPVASTIAHEIGHMFGAEHTFSNRIGSYTEKTEVGSGQSIMSYGSPRDFFSLTSLHTIRKVLGNSLAYYTDRERTHKEGKQVEGYSNIVFGVKSNNKPPKIQTAKLKKEYTIPASSFFQFYIEASDQENDLITYMAHPADRDFYGEGNARFLTYKGNENNCIRYQEEWVESERNTFVSAEYTTRTPEIINYYKPGSFSFWLAAADHNPKDPNHLVKYDVFETKLNIVQGTPFVMKDFDNGDYSRNRTYKAGEKLTLHWDVDKNIFGEDSKVRILLSDDSGKSYKYVIKDNVPNNGSCEITMPNVSIGTTRGHFGKQKGQGIIKIEVIDGLAYALSCLSPYKQGGFMVEKDQRLAEPLQFIPNTLPKDITLQDNANIPQAILPQTTGGCSTPNITYKDVTNTEKYAPNVSIERTFTAEDTCGNKTTHTQIILILKEAIKPLTFIESTLPQKEITVHCTKLIPLPAQVKTTGGLSEPVLSNEDIISDRKCENTYTIKRIYKAQDNKEIITYEQTIHVVDNILPNFIGELPKDTTIFEDEKIPTPVQLNASDNCDENVSVSFNQEIVQKNGKTTQYLYKWIASDKCNNTISHTQTITIKEKPPVVKPNPPIEKPKDDHTKPNTGNQNTEPNNNATPPTPPKTQDNKGENPSEVIVYNGISLENNDRNYFKVENTDENTPISIRIFNEMGLEVYFSDHYQEGNNIFRGFSNMKNVFSNGTPLHGTYFYIMKYYKNNTLHTKKGFLYIE